MMEEIEMIGPGSIALIVGAALVIFGPKKLPELGRAAGDTLREFKNATKDMMDDSPKKKPNKKTCARDRNFHEPHWAPERIANQIINHPAILFSRFLCGAFRFQAVNFISPKR